MSERRARGDRDDIDAMKKKNIPPTSQTTSPPPDDGLHILLVEDDAAAAALVRELLALAAPASCTVTHVPRLAAALAALRNDAVDAVLLDLNLPDAQGLHALTMLRATAPRVPVVILSANADGELARQGVQAGAQDYLVKDRVTPEGLLRALRYAIERQRSQERLTYLAFHDALTGLPNRALLENRLDHALASARRQRERLALLFLDLDGFKEVNDGLGHEAGDRLLAAVAARLSGCTRSSDTVARLGGDEFVVLLPGADATAATVVAAKTLATVGAPYILDERNSVSVTASIGIGLYPDDGADGSALLRRADEAMYAAKQRGKNAYTFARDGGDQRAMSGIGA